MTDKSLLSLREVSRVMNVRYRTILSLRNQLGDFAPGMHDGKYKKYLPESVELFSLVYALREEGYTFPMIRSFLAQEREIKNDQQICEWVKDVISKVGPFGADNDVYGSAGTSLHKQAQTSTNMHIQACAGTNPHVPGCASADQCEQACTGTNQGEPAQPNTNQHMPEGTGKFELSEEQIDKIKQEIEDRVCKEVEKEIGDRVLEEVHSIPGKMEDVLLQLVANINGSMTQIYKAVQELQAGIETLDQRLGHLERELENEQGEDIHLQDMDLDALQIQRLEIELLNKNNPEEHSGEDGHTPEINLNQLRSRIHNGRPDKTAVIEWIKSEKLKDPEISYGELARMLNTYGIPTLSGRSTWCRTVVRSLALK